MTEAPTGMFDLDLYSLTFAQDGAAVAPGESPATGTGQPGGGPPPGGAPNPFGTMLLPILVGFILLMVVTSMRGQRKERKKREAMMGAVKKHDRVQTIGGMIGSIVELKNDTVVLKVDESSNTRITFSRSAIQQVLDSSEEPAAASLN